MNDNRRSKMTPTGPATINGVEYVDLNLPSGNLWAKYNIGAQTETEIGYYYPHAGDLDISRLGYSITDWKDDDYSSSIPNYPYHTASAYETGVPRDIVLQTIGAPWAIPSISEYDELKNNTNKSTVTIDGVRGIKFTSKTDAEKYIFFPNTGYWNVSQGSASWILNYSYSSIGLYMNVCDVYSSSARVYYVDGGYATSMSPRNGFQTRAVIRPQMNVNVLFYNTISNLKGVFDLYHLPPNESGWTPIAIEIVPKEHNRYGDGSAGFMAINTLDTNGEVRISNYIINYERYNLMYAVDNSSSESGIPDHINNSSSRDIFVQYAMYTSINNSIFPNDPSIQYSSNDILSDYNGKYYTDIINNSTHPAAAACKLYSTEGTNVGDWYMPTIAELGYYLARQCWVWATLVTLAIKYNLLGTCYSKGDYSQLGSCIPYGSSYYYIALNPSNEYDNRFSTYSKTSGSEIRPFIKYKY